MSHPGPSAFTELVGVPTGPMRYSQDFFYENRNKMLSFIVYAVHYDMHDNNFLSEQGTLINVNKQTNKPPFQATFNVQCVGFKIQVALSMIKSKTFI